MKKILQTEDLVFLRLAKDELDAQQINCLIKNEYPPAAGEITPMVAWPELWIIDDKDEAKAKETVASLQATNTHVAGSWSCPQCHEKVENTFNLCWNCGSNQDSPSK